MTINDMKRLQEIQKRLIKITTTGRGDIAASVKKGGLDDELLILCLSVNNKMSIESFDLVDLITLAKMAQIND